MKRQSVAIVGSGTAGLATAIVLAKQGHDITIFEQVPQMENVGAGCVGDWTSVCRIKSL